MSGVVELFRVRCDCKENNERITEILLALVPVHLLYSGVVDDCEELSSGFIDGKEEGLESVIKQVD
jgi:hypothetical protein